MPFSSEAREAVQSQPGTEGGSRSALWEDVGLIRLLAPVSASLAGHVEG